MNKAGKVAIGCVAAVAALIVGVVLAVGGYYAWKHYGSNTTETVVEEQDEAATVEAEASFTQLLEQAQWSVIDGSLRYPSFMRHTQSRVAAVPALVDVYRWKAVDLCFWARIGSWAMSAASYPVDGCYLTATDRIADVTVKDDEKGLYAGHAVSKKMYYMKKKVVHEANSDHVVVAVVVFPEDMDAEVQQLKDMVREW